MRDLHTERLFLRPFDDGDVDFVFDMYSRWDVQRFIGTPPRVLTNRMEAVEKIARYTALDRGGLGVWLIADRHTGARFGAALLKPLPASGAGEPLSPSGETEIGWHLHPDAWGRGIATEAAARVLRHGFDEGLVRVLAVTNPANGASQAVARRIGMRDEGLTKAYYDTTCALFRADVDCR